MQRRRFLSHALATTSVLVVGSCGAERPILAQADTGADPRTCSLTTGDAQGPFFLSGAQSRSVLGPDGTTPTIHMRGVILGADCQPMSAGHSVDVWHADAEGAYQMEGTEAYLYRGLLQTDADGRFEIATIRPGNYSVGRNYMRPAHYHFKVYAPDGSELVTTQFYFDDDAYLGEGDGCQPNSCNSYDEARYLHLTTGDGGMQTTDFQIIV